MKVSTKMHIPLILVLLFGLSVILVTSYRSTQTIRQNAYQEEGIKLEHYFQQKYQAKMDIAISNAINLAQSQIPPAKPEA
jgi:predicted histidine transporter YuiF (NhaC family)